MPKEFERSRRCAPCNLDWPLTQKYAICPLCGQDTDLGILDPMDHDEAQRLCNEAKNAAEKRVRDNARMDEAEVEMWARAHGIDLSRTAARSDGAPRRELD